jgi:hypothetical protein
MAGLLPVRPTRHFIAVTGPGQRNCDLFQSWSVFLGFCSVEQGALGLESPEASVSLHWLRRQGQILGDQEFRRLLAEHLEAEFFDAVSEWLNQRGD